jgi:hypothetical protein
MSSLSPTPRVAIALALLLFALVELLRLLALAVAPDFHVLAEHAALGLLAGLAGFALWRRIPWAPAAILALGYALATVRLIDAFVLGIRPWLFALLAAVAAVIAAMLLAAWAKQAGRELM